MSLLQVSGVDLYYGDAQALAGVTLHIDAGEIVAIVGANGAGKSSLIRALQGIEMPTTGSVRFDGQDITGWRPDRITTRGLVRTFQIARGCPRLTVLENLLLYGQHQPGEGVLAALLRTNAMRQQEHTLRRRAAEIAGRLQLTPVLNNKAAALSGGQKKLLEIGRALMATPKLILLDEPTAGVNPTLARQISQRLRDIVSDGISLFLIEHQMDMIARLCDHVIVMADGRRLTEGSFAAVAADATVQEAYMGGPRWAC